MPESFSRSHPGLLDSPREDDSPIALISRETSVDIAIELGRLRVNADDEFLVQLEKNAAEAEKKHVHALAAAAAEHQRIRQSAEAVRAKHEELIHRERIRRKDEEQRELEKLKKERADREIAQQRREAERALSEEAEAKAKRHAEEVRARAEAERRRKAEQEHYQKAQAEQERQRLEREASARKLEDDRNKEKLRIQERQHIEQQQLRSQPLADKVGSSSRPATSENHDNATHTEYLNIHQRLKEVRRMMIDQGKRHPPLKKQVGDWRREIRKRVGQLTATRGANKTPMQSITEIIKQARSLTASPPIDVRLFLVTKHSGPRSPNAVDESAEVPAIFIYLLNIFAKAIVAQFIDEAGVSPKAADPVGIVAASIFANDALRWSGFSLIDILMCKFHVVCPVLWGMYGDDKTTQGKRSLGWWREEKDGPWVSDQRHAERMTGLGAGYAAITLRSFQKSNFTNPFPNYHYWQSFASIVNLPPGKASATHFIVLKAMIENHESRLLEFYGHAAIAALRKALIDFPREAGNETVAASALAVLPDVLKRDKKLTL